MEKELSLEDVVHRVSEDLGTETVPVAVAIVNKTTAVALSRHPENLQVLPGCGYMTHVVGIRSCEQGHYDLTEEKGWASFNSRTELYREGA